MTNQELTFEPSLSLTVPRPSNSEASVLTSSADNGQLFLLFSDDWLNIQSFCAQALQLPINTSQWSNMYGDFSSKAKVSEVLDSLKSLKNLASTFGDPTIIKDKIIHGQNYLSQKEPPAEIYGHIIWLASQIQNTAGTFSFTYKQLATVLSPAIEPDPTARYNNLKEILTGPGGLQVSAKVMSERCNVLLKKLIKFERDITPIMDSIGTYVTGQDSLIAEANHLVGELRVQLSELQNVANDTYKKWKILTITAIVSSILIAILSILSFGLLLPLAIAVGGGLGIAAEVMRAKYNGLMKQISQKNVEIQKKLRLVNDLTSLNTIMPDLNNSLGSFNHSLQSIQGVWLGVDTSLSYIFNNYSVEQLSDINFIMQAFKVLDAQQKWADIAETSKQFTQNSMISFSNKTNFGQEINIA